MARRRSTPLVAGRTTGTLRRRLLVVDDAVELVLLTAVSPTGGDADLTEENRAAIAPTHELKQLLQMA